MSDETLTPPAEEPTPAPESAPQAPPAETPASASVVAENAPADAVSTDGQQTAEAMPATAEAPDSAVSDAPAPAPDVDPLTVLSADLERVSSERDTLQANHDRMYAEVNTLQRDLDAARAELAEERATRSPLAYQQQITDMRLRISQLEEENTQLKQQVPAVAQAVHVATLEAVQSAPVDLSDAAHARIKSDFLDALAEHSVAQVVPEAEPEPEAPAPNPFINRQG